MKHARNAAAALVLSLVASVAAAQVTMFDGSNFRGANFQANWPVYNLDGYGFNDRASSVIVDRGRWQFCEDANFQGRCVTLQAGQYPTLNDMGLNGRISSFRPAGQQNYDPYPPAKPPGYSYYPRYGEPTYPAQVTSVRAVLGPPQQQCWTEHQSNYNRDRQIGGAILGGILGGVIGHQFGSGRGNDVATAVGAVGGAAAGANVAGRSGGQTIQRCDTIPNSGQPEYWDVSYRFRGKDYRAQLSFPPGDTITVNGRGEPRM
jgi:uncharacterized protein YcfJ